MILDTEFLGALRARDTDARNRARELESSDDPLRVPTVVTFELFVSVGKTDDRTYKIADQRAYRRLVVSKPVVPLSESVARRAGVVAGTHQRSDRKPTLGTADAVVAATALERNEPVVSGDADFDTVAGLVRVGY